MTPEERLKEAITERGLTLDAFAQLLGQKLQRVKDVLRGKQRLPQDMIEGLYRHGFDVSHILTGKSEQERRGSVEAALRAIADATREAMALELDARKRELVRDVLIGVKQGNAKLIDATIEHYVAVRAAEPAAASVQETGSEKKTRRK